MAFAYCEYCYEVFKYKPSQSYGRYCSNKCQHDANHHTLVLAYRLGLHPGTKSAKLQLSSFVKRDLWDCSGTACQRCGWDEKHPVDGRPLTQFDHIDGDASNSRPWNLRILCPNCHSMTPTFGARNKNSARNPLSRV